jgi:hypothetical protein
MAVRLRGFRYSGEWLQISSYRVIPKGRNEGLPSTQPCREDDMARCPPSDSHCEQPDDRGGC